MSITAPTRYPVLGVNVSALSLPLATGLIVERARQRPADYVCVTGVHGVMEAQDDPALRRILNAAFLNTPDGMPLVWLGRWHGHRQVTRVYGPDLMLAVCDAGRAVGLTHYFYGGAPGVAEEMHARLAARFPGLRVVGTGTPPFRPLTAGEAAAFQAEVARTRPDVLWVGLSTPKQERFMAAHAAMLDAGLLVGVGAAFDFHAGRVRQAPRWVQRSGGEWLFRLGHEPRRLGPRYLKIIPRFFWCLSLQAVGLRRYPPD